MKNKGMNLAWIMASDFQKSLKFYTEVLGLTLTSPVHPEFEWAELQGEDGAMIGLGGTSCAESAEKEATPHAPGKNAVLTFTVDDIEASRKELDEKGVKLLGDIQVIPGHVKMQLFCDPDGNLGQLVQLLA